MNNFGVEEWVALFEEVGLDQPKRHQWHEAFERSAPQAHQSFLEWLSLDQERIAKIRNASKNGSW